MSITEHCPLFSHSLELSIFYWETLSLCKHMILTEIQIEKSVQLIIQVANHLHAAWWHRRTLTVLNWNTPQRTIDRPTQERTYCVRTIAKGVHHFPWLRSLWYIVSDEDTNFRIQRRHSNMGQVGPAIYIVLWRHLFTWHWHRLLSEYHRQRNKRRLVETTNLQVGYSKTRGGTLSAFKVVRLMVVLLPHTPKSLMRCSVMRVSLLPGSRKAYVQHSLSPNTDFTRTGTIGIVSRRVWHLLTAALVTAGTPEEEEWDCSTAVETEAESAPGPGGLTPDWSVPARDRCNKVGWAPLHTSQVALWEHWERMWSLPRQSKHNLCFIRKEILSLWSIFRNFLQVMNECGNSQNIHRDSDTETARGAGVLSLVVFATVPAEVTFLFWLDAPPLLRSVELNAAFPNTGFNLILFSDSRNSTSLLKVTKFPSWYKILSATRAQRSWR